jgi:phenylacetate-CoA ligase
VATTFVSPAHVDTPRLRKAMTWFDEARDRLSAGPPHLDEGPWRTIPFTRKPDLREHLRPYPDTGRWITWLCSSGTTAEPVVSPWSEVDQQIADSTAREIHARCPSIDGARCAVIAPSPSLAVAHFMMREIQLSGGVPVLVTPDQPEAMWRKLISEGVQVVFALPLVASRLGEYFYATHGRSPAGISLLFCGGDVLSPARQVMLAALWDAQVLNMFGCSELFGPLAGPGREGNPLTWHCEPIGVEVIDPSTLLPCAARELGVLVVTTLWPKASPLQRYWTDDVVEIVQAASVDQPFTFHYVGRPPSMLHTGRATVALRDIDNALLGSGWCASEWSVRHTPQAICVDAEVLSRTPAVLSELQDAMTEMVGAPVEFTAREPGSMSRFVPKFCVAREPD